jgi:hypothetical protein
MSTTITSLVLFALGSMSYAPVHAKQGNIGPIKLTGSSLVVVDDSRSTSPLAGAAKKTIGYNYTIELNEAPSVPLIVYIDDSSGGLHHPTSVTFAANQLTKVVQITGMYAPRSGYLTAYNANSTVSLAVSTVYP